jgi:DNA-binding XRE family transcriptional regulator
MPLRSVGRRGPGWYARCCNTRPKRGSTPRPGRSRGAANLFSAFQGASAFKISNLDRFLSKNNSSCLIRLGASSEWRQNLDIGPVDLVSSSQIRAARVLLGWTQDQLAEAAEVSLNAVARFEQEKGDARMGTLTKIVRALEQGGIEFLPPSDGKGPGVRLKRAVKGR